MPTSTVWRPTVTTSISRGLSPSRPSDEFIERISPEPFFPPTVEELAHNRYNFRQDSSSLHGLGLSHTSSLQNSGVTAHPDHLYIDHNGGAHVGTRPVGAGLQQDQYQRSLSYDRPSRYYKLQQESRRSRAKGHTRSGSTIDDLASAAIATSPSFHDGSPNSYHFNTSPINYNQTRPYTSHAERYDYVDSIYEPRAKRIKSEKLPTTEWTTQTERPSTSHLSSHEVSNEEAALLLGLRTEVNFKTQASPPTPPSAVMHYTSNTIYQPSTPPPPVDQYSVEDKSILEPQGQEATPMDRSRQATSETEVEKTDDAVIVDVLAAERPSHAEQEISVTEAEINATNVKEPPIVSEDIMAGPPAKKIRRVKPEVQAEVCAECNNLQRDTDGNDDATISWICCNACERWLHAMCAGFKTKAEARSVDKFVCKDCEPVHGKTTFVRKSSRARTAIDYAGLNEGVVKASADSSMHHYIQPIKDGRITFLPDDFARVRPELVTAEFFESADGMKRPFVVPACWNPRFGGSKPAETLSIFDPDWKEERYTSSGSRVGPEAEQLDDNEPDAVGHGSDFSAMEVIDCDQDFLDMVMPRDLTVRKVAELYGPNEPVPVIETKTQETKGAFTLGQWADYYETPGDKPIRNVISLEVSESPLGRLIRRPKAVRELDLEDHVWDHESKSANKKRPVQFYCLMSVADCYTDFHIDFGGSSVYYHILKGTKTFFFIPPEDKYLKKYEEWCNSADQNEVFLGSLCNNNCTRVDLHEGDTAFIPAGWIHAVWTPEDSLVIGGNYLTRLDYEMQLKVSNVEKVTKVSPKFRYPFFQKVMWYALIKYLEDDPVPDSILHAFLDDSDFTYLRANNVWHELGELTNDAEPGTAEYNARHYPKTEINGLSALRDYLYRTARIHADLPVSDINKKGMDAVKASIPKGYGDPLMLIKTFAIWCAWKTGCVTVPEWVYTDGPELAEAERKEKLRKSEPSRFPGERISLRRASQAVIRDSPDAPVITPTKPVNSESGPDSDSGKKSKTSAKGSGLKVACEPCRKRRIKCRHKEGEVSPTSHEAPIRPRSYSAISNDVPTTIAPAPHHDPAKLSSPEAFQSDQSFPSNLAQAALATLDSQTSEYGQSMTNGIMSGNGKKSRSKACEECRKSKRRCVHDEHGRVDPAKAAEPTKPRGSNGTKRSARASDDDPQAKRTKTEIEQDEISSTPQYVNIDSLIDPALMNGDYDQPFDEDTMDIDIFDSTLADQIQQHGILAGNWEERVEAENLQPIQSNDSMPPIDPNLSSTNVKLDPEHDSMIPIMDVIESEQRHSPADDPTDVNKYQEVNHSMQVRSGQEADLNGISPSSRHSSRQPKQVERYTPEHHRSPSKLAGRQGRDDRRASSAVSGQTIFTIAKSRRSSSNTSRTTHQVATSTSQRHGSSEVRPGSRDSTIESDQGADEKFARELQAAENGLRRRASLRA